MNDLYNELKSSQAIDTRLRIILFWVVTNKVVQLFNVVRIILRRKMQIRLIKNYKDYLTEYLIIYFGRVNSLSFLVHFFENVGQSDTYKNNWLWS